MQSLDGFRDTTSDTSVSDHVSWVVPSDTDSHSHVFVFSVEPKVRDRPGEGGHSWTLFPVGHLSSCLAAVRPPPAPTARLRPSLPLPCPLILQSFLRSSGSVSVTEFTQVLSEQFLTTEAWLDLFFFSALFSGQTQDVCQGQRLQGQTQWLARTCLSLFVFFPTLNDVQCFQQVKDSDKEEPQLLPNETLQDMGGSSLIGSDSLGQIVLVN